MSYSRWISSPWYSFWNSSSPVDIKEEQILSLWYDGNDYCLDLTYNQLKNLTKQDLVEYYPVAEDYEIEEALGIIKLFLGDVDEEYDRDKK